MHSAVRLPLTGRLPLQHRHRGHPGCVLCGWLLRDHRQRGCPRHRKTQGPRPLLYGRRKSGRDSGDNDCENKINTHATLTPARTCRAFPTSVPPPARMPVPIPPAIGSRKNPQRASSSLGVEDGGVRRPAKARWPPVTQNELPMVFQTPPSPASRMPSPAPMPKFDVWRRENARATTAGLPAACGIALRNVSAWPANATRPTAPGQTPRWGSRAATPVPQRRLIALSYGRGASMRSR
jgi:hypothetical protein